MAFTDGANDLPVVGGVKFSGIADSVLTTAGIWVPRSSAAGDAMAAKFAMAVGLYGWNTATMDRLKSGQIGAVPLSGVLNTALGVYDSAATGFRTIQTLNNVADANGGSNGLMQGAFTFNETNWDRHRGNTSITALASAARTAATSTGALVNYNGRGIQADLTVTAKAAATTITIQLLNPVGATIATSGVIAAASGAGYSVQFYPGILAAAFSGNGQGVSVAVPRNYILVVTPSDANSVTYSVLVQTIE